MIEQKPGLIDLATERTGRTPLHMCCAPPQYLGYLGYSVTALKLIEKGADVNAIDKDDNSPLHLALESRKYELALTGASFDIKNNKGETPREIIRKAKENLIKQLDNPEASERDIKSINSSLQSIARLDLQIVYLDNKAALPKPRKNLKLFGKEIKDMGIVDIKGMSLGDMASKAYNALPNNPFKNKGTKSR